MDMDKPLHTEKHRMSPAEIMADIQDQIANCESEIHSDIIRKNDVKMNMSLSNKEISILTIGLDLSIVKREREMFKLKAQLATHRLAFQKETFWRSL
jgi:hypothetical protein